MEKGKPGATFATTSQTRRVEAGKPRLALRRPRKGPWENRPVVQYFTRPSSTGNRTLPDPGRRREKLAEDGREQQGLL